MKSPFALRRLFLLKLPLQLAITTGCCVWLVRKTGLLDELRPALAAASWNWLAAAFFIYSAVEFFAAIRWHFILRDCGIELSWAASIRVLLLSVFLNTVIPGLIGGDAFRALHLARAAPERKPSGLCAVCVDRLFGMAGLILLGASFVAFRYRWLSRSPLGEKLAAMTLILVSLGAAAPVFIALAGRVRSRGMQSRTLAGIGRSGRLLGYRPSFGSGLIALAATAAAHLCFCLSFYCTARAFDAVNPHPVLLLDMMTLTPIVNTFTSLPISFSGVGIRESIFGNLLYQLGGVPTAVGILTGSVGFAIRAVWAVCGALAVLMKTGAPGAGKVRNLEFALQEDGLETSSDAS